MSGPGPGVARALALALAGLRGVAGWDPVDALAERAAEALRGGDGLAAHDAARLQRFARAWSALRPEVRAFYRAALDRGHRLPVDDQSAVSVGLWSLLDGGPRRAPAWARGRLARLHRDLLGEDAGVDLTAPPRTTNEARPGSGGPPHDDEEER